MTKERLFAWVSQPSMHEQDAENEQKDRNSAHELNPTCTEAGVGQ